MPHLKTEDFSGELLRHLRLLKGIKQKEAGKMMKISQQAYSKIEQKKNISWPLLLAVLAAFNSNIEELSKIKEIL